MQKLTTLHLILMTLNCSAECIFTIAIGAALHDWQTDYKIAAPESDHNNVAPSFTAPHSACTKKHRTLDVWYTCGRLTLLCVCVGYNCVA